MKLVVLTTQTTHHAYFVREIQNYYAITHIFLEEESVKPTFDTSHSYEETRETVEQEKWFDGDFPKIKDLAPTSTTPSMNETAAIQALSELNPDVIIVFGVGKLSSDVINICPNGIINLHGGSPERYRGLDSHLWAIYHRDYSALATTIHRLRPQLDTGDIIAQQRLAFPKNCQMTELRKINTEACVKLTITALEMYERHGDFITKAQSIKGRYYSFMPSALKEICVKRFEDYTQKL